MAKKPTKYNQNAVIRGALRRAFARSPLVQQKMAESRREVPRYNKDGSRSKKDAVQRQCEVCKSWVGSTKIAVDHINPVVSVDDGFQDWNEFVDRLWCDIKNLQRICDTCHDVKTNIERTTRSNKKDMAEMDQIEKEANNRPTKEHLKRLKALSKKKNPLQEPVVNRAKQLIDRYDW